MFKQDQINQLKKMSKDFTKKVDLLSKMTTQQTSKMENEDMKKASIMTHDLKKAMSSAFKGNTSELTSYINKHANINK